MSRSPARQRRGLLAALGLASAIAALVLLAMLGVQRLEGGRIARAAVAECRTMYRAARTRADTLRADRHVPQAGALTGGGTRHRYPVQCGHWRRAQPGQS